MYSVVSETAGQHQVSKPRGGDKFALFTELGVSRFEMPCAGIQMHLLAAMSVSSLIAQKEGKTITPTTITT